MCPPPLVFGAQKKPGLDRVKVASYPKIVSLNTLERCANTQGGGEAATSTKSILMGVVFDQISKSKALLEASCLELNEDTLYLNIRQETDE